MSQQELYEKDLERLALGEVKQGKMRGWTVYLYRHETFGHICGYVEVGYMDIDIEELDVHVGITFYDDMPSRFPDTKGKLIGFDCSHDCDWTPTLPSEWKTYKGVAYATKELYHLTAQLQRVTQNYLVWRERYGKKF